MCEKSMTSTKILGCPSGYLRFHEACYKKELSSVNWHQAVELCESIENVIAAPNSEAELVCLGFTLAPSSSSLIRKFFPKILLVKKTRNLSNHFEKIIICNSNNLRHRYRVVSGTNLQQSQAQIRNYELQIQGFR